MHKTKQDRQAEAIERQQDRDNRTTAEQLHIIRQRPGKSAREKTRLMIGGKVTEADMRDR